MSFQPLSRSKDIQIGWQLGARLFKQFVIDTTEPLRFDPVNATQSAFEAALGESFRKTLSGKFATSKDEGSRALEQLRTEPNPATKTRRLQFARFVNEHAHGIARRFVAETQSSSGLTLAEALDAMRLGFVFALATDEKPQFMATKTFATEHVIIDDAATSEVRVMQRNLLRQVARLALLREGAPPVKFASTIQNAAFEVKGLLRFMPQDIVTLWNNSQLDQARGIATPRLIDAAFGDVFVPALKAVTPLTDRSVPELFAEACRVHAYAAAMACEQLRELALNPPRELVVKFELALKERHENVINNTTNLLVPDVTP